MFSSPNMQHPDLRPMLERWATRFSPEPTGRQRLVEMTIVRALHDIDRLGTGPIEKALFCLMREIVIEDATPPVENMAAAE